MNTNHWQADQLNRAHQRETLRHAEQARLAQEARLPQDPRSHRPRRLMAKFTAELPRLPERRIRKPILEF